MSYVGIGERPGSTAVIGVDGLPMNGRGQTAGGIHPAVQIRGGLDVQDNDFGLAGSV